MLEKSIPQVHHLSSLGKPSDAKRRSMGWIFLLYPHTHDRFLYCTLKLFGPEHEILVLIQYEQNPHLKANTFASSGRVEVSNLNGVANTSKKLCTSKGEYCIKQWFSTIVPFGNWNFS